MPNHTVSGNVNTMMRAVDNAAIRSAIGVGQTDAPTFLAQTLTGQSLTGTQATSLVDLSATWNTTGNPSLIYGRVTNTNSGASANLIDLGTFAGGSLFSVTKQGRTQTEMVGSSVTSSFSGILFSSTIHSHYVNGAIYLDVRASGTTIGGALGTGATLSADAPNILAQRNGTNAQAFRVANSVGASPLVDYDRGTFGFPAGTNTLRIGTENGGTYTSARPIDFVTGGVVQLTINPAQGGILFNGGGVIYSNANEVKSRGTVFQIQGVSGAAGAALSFVSRGYIVPAADGVFTLNDNAGTSFNRLQLGGTTSAFPAIKRNGTGIHIVLADDSAFAPVKGKITTDTAYTATTVVATGYITLYDSTGTAYRVPCAV